jgi:hypothetical protein
VDENDRRRGPCARAELDGAETVTYAYLSSNDAGRLAMHLFPGDTLTQARALYGAPARAARLMTLAGLGWDLQPKFHFGFAKVSVVYTRSRLGVEEYIRYWAARMPQVAPVPRADWQQTIAGLTAAGIFNASDRPEFDRHFTNTNRQSATLRPGICLSREWEAASSRAPGFPEVLRTAIWQALHALGEYAAAATAAAVAEGPQPTASPVDFVAAAVEEAAGKAGRAGRGQGYQMDQRIRAATEQHAMRAAQAHYEGDGWEVGDVHATQSFDLVCRKGPEEKHVEVKGSGTQANEIILTPNEVRHARAYNSCALFVLGNIHIEVSEDGTVSPSRTAANC